MSKNKAIGIDLGTSKCCVGVVRDGKVEILENERGNKTTPSYVAFTDTERLVGDDAKDQATLNPDNTVFGIKRFMCMTFNEHAKMAHITKSNANVAPFPSTYKNNKQKLLPQQISAMLLTKMKSLAEDHLKNSVEEAVISVPASFSNAQRQATKDAAAIAGLKVLALINEPTAAAIAFQTNRRSKGEETIVVVDFGAGKLDVSVIALNDGNICVKGVSGSTDIGGNDVDVMLMSHIINAYKKIYNKDPPLDRGVMERLRSICEKIKRKFSLLPKVQETLDCFGEDYKLPITMSRDEFNNMLPTKFQESLESCLANSLKVAKLDRMGISRVLLVGGSTRLLAIQEWLRKIFACPIDKSVNPDEAVAVGAAVQAALLSGDHEVKELVVQDAIGMAFYLLPEGDTHKKWFVFGRNYLAAAPSKEYSLNTDAIRHKTYDVYEKFIGRKNANSYIGSYSYSSDLCCRVDRCGIFNVGVLGGRNRDGSYELKDVQKEVLGKLLKEDLRNFVEEEQKFRKDGLEEKSRMAAMSNLESLCFRYQHYLQKISVTEFVPESIPEFAKQVRENIDCLNSAASFSTTEYCEKKKILEQQYNKVLEEVRQHEEKVEKERVDAVNELVKCCFELPFCLIDGEKTFRESQLLRDTLNHLHELFVKWAAPNSTFTKAECDECIATLRSMIRDDNNAGETGTTHRTATHTPPINNTGNHINTGDFCLRSKTLPPSCSPIHNDTVAIPSKAPRTVALEVNSPATPEGPQPPPSTSSYLAPAQEASFM